MLSPVPLNAPVVDGSEVLRFNVLLLGLGVGFTVLALCSMCGSNFCIITFSLPFSLVLQAFYYSCNHASYYYGCDNSSHPPPSSFRPPA